MSNNRQTILGELKELIEYYDYWYHSFEFDRDPKYEASCNRMAHMSTVFEYFYNILSGKLNDYSLKDKYIQSVEDEQGFGVYTEDFVKRLKKELEWIQ